MANFAVALHLERQVGTAVRSTIQLEIVSANSPEEALGEVLLNTKQDGMLGAFKVREILSKKEEQKDESNNA